MKSFDFYKLFILSLFFIIPLQFSTSYANSVMKDRQLMTVAKLKKPNTAVLGEVKSKRVYMPPGRVKKYEFSAVKKQNKQMQAKKVHARKANAKKPKLNKQQKALEGAAKLFE